MPTTKKTKVKVTCIECPNCKDIIYSRANHDCHHCSCGGLMIDGGFDYTRMGGREFSSSLKPFSKFIMGVNKKDLYQDWNCRTDKYGRIKPEGREVKEVRKVIKLWAFGDEWTIQNKKLQYFVDYRLHDGMVEVIKPLFNRKDFNIFHKIYFTLIDDIIIDYEIKDLK